MNMLPRIGHAGVALSAVLGAAVVAAGSSGRTGPVASLDLDRYLGRWYVIAQAPAGGPDLKGAWFEHRRRADGAIDDIYAVRQGSFEDAPAAVERRAEPDPQQPARWRVRAGWFASSERWILYVSPDYRHAIAGTPDSTAAWILARDPVIPEWTYAGLLARLAMHGYDVSRLQRVPQKPDRVGKPGLE